MTESWIAAQDAGYICTMDHSLLRVSNESISALSAPGECDVVSNDGEMNLIASIRQKGVFRYTPTGGWTLIAQSPYPEGNGDYSAYLANSRGFLAMAIDGKPVVDASRTTATRMHFTRNAPTALWVLEHGGFKSIPLK
jgi:hypothetical protein